MKWQENYVLKNGQINEGMIIKKEPLETRSHGRVIERVYVTPTDSFILKSFTNDKQSVKEIWIQENILSLFPDFYPQIVANSITTYTNNGWIAFEDLGYIKHTFSYEILHNVIKQMVWWHSLPTQAWEKAPLNGPKPKIEAIQSEILQNKDKIIHTISNHIQKKNLNILFSLLERWTFSKKNVLSHGDLHLGNYGIAKNKLVVLDWEFTHLNTRCWDLYHLIDLSHPLYPKTVSNEIRNQILTEYYQQTLPYGIEQNQETFNTEYYLFSAAFSLWMLGLIKTDLKQITKKWSEAALKSQLTETVKNLNQCIEELTKLKS